MTPSQMRAMRAKQLMDSGKTAEEVARELGYKTVNGMLGAIVLCSRKIERDEKKILQMINEKPAEVIRKEVTEDGVRAELVFHTDEPVLDLLADGHADPVGEPGAEGPAGEGEPNPAYSLQAVTREAHAAMHDGYRADVVVVDEMHELCSAKRLREAEVKPTAKVYPVENRIVAIRRPNTWVSIKMDEMQVRINVTSNYGVNRWLALYGKHIGKEALVQTLREIAEATTEAAALIEEAGYVDHHA